MDKSICIIGAGPAGLCAAKRCYEAGFRSITVFEQSQKVGGLWNYTDEINVHSSMYDKLIINVPREFMSFKDFIIPDYDNSGRSFFEGKYYLRYLNEFADPIRNLIQFDHEIINVTRENNVWKVTIRDLMRSSEATDQNFDVIFVCTGTCTKPYLPNFADKYKSPSIHSHNYRKAEHFEGKTVAIIGGGWSGTDICEQLAKYAKQIYFLGHKEKTENFEFPQNVVKLPNVIDADEASLHLENGTILSNLDMVIYCTGYRYDYSFIDENIIQVKHDGKVVSPLFMHFAHRDYLDSFFIVGLNFWAVASLIIEQQILLAIALIKKEASGFTEQDVKEWEETRTKELTDHGLSLKHFHHFTYPPHVLPWEYFDRCARYANAPKWIPNVCEKILNHMITMWMRLPCEFKNVNYKILNDEEFEIEKL